MMSTFLPDSGHREQRLALLQRLHNTPAGLDEILEITVLKGVAYHHAGLTTEERELIENAYNEGVLKVLCVRSFNNLIYL